MSPLQDELMLCAAYLALGARTRLLLADRESYSRAINGIGELEFISRAIAYAPQVEGRWQAMSQDERDGFSMVWAYEICEPFGEAYALAMLAGQEFDAGATLDRLLA